MWVWTYALSGCVTRLLWFRDLCFLWILGSLRQWVCQHPRTAPVTGKGFSSGRGVPSNLTRDRGNHSRVVLIASEWGGIAPSSILETQMLGSPIGAHFSQDGLLGVWLLSLLSYCFEKLKYIQTKCPSADDHHPQQDICHNSLLGLFVLRKKWYGELTAFEHRSQVSLSTGSSRQSLPWVRCVSSN